MTHVNLDMEKHDFSFGFESENSPKHGFDVAGTGHVLIYGKCSGLTDSPVCADFARLPPTTPSGGVPAHQSVCSV